MYQNIKKLAQKYALHRILERRTNRNKFDRFGWIINDLVLILPTRGGGETCFWLIFNILMDYFRSFFMIDSSIPILSVRFQSKIRMAMEFRLHLIDFTLILTYSLYIYIYFFLHQNQYTQTFIWMAQ